MVTVIKHIFPFIDVVSTAQPPLVFRITINTISSSCNLSGIKYTTREMNVAIIRISGIEVQPVASLFYNSCLFDYSKCTTANIQGTSRLSIPNTVLISFKSALIYGNGRRCSAISDFNGQSG